MRLRGKIYGESALWTDDVPVIYRISNVYLSCIYRVSIVYLSCIYRISIVYLAYIYRISIVFNMRIDRKMFEKKTRKESISNRKYNGQKMIIPKI